MKKNTKRYRDFRGTIESVEAMEVNDIKGFEKQTLEKVDSIIRQLDKYLFSYVAGDTTSQKMINANCMQILTDSLTPLIDKLYAISIALDFIRIQQIKGNKLNK